MKELWYQKYRPETVENYVFTDDRLKHNVEKWIEQQDFPHLLLSGNPGSGKCLDGSELVDVEIDAEKIRLPIKELFSILNLDNIDYEKPTSVSYKVKINSPIGYVEVNSFVKKHHTVAEYVLDDDTRIRCSTKHIVFDEEHPVKISDASKLDTIYGPKEIIGTTKLGERDVYDVALDAPHKYITPNGIIHHNTSLGHLLISQCGFEDVDVKHVSGSIYRHIDDFEDDILGFAEKQSFGPKGRAVLIDEGDRLTPMYQDALRNVIGGDEYTNCRFIITCNYPHKINGALKSRLEHLTFDVLDRDQFTYRVAEILTNEKVELDLNVLNHYVENYYPDLRKTINKVQNNVVDNVLKEEEQSSSSDGPDWMKKAVIFFQDGNIRQAREEIINNIAYEDYEYFYKMLYDNLHWFGDIDDKKDAALFAIKNAYVEDHSVGNREIVLSACLTKLARVYNS